MDLSNTVSSPTFSVDTLTSVQQMQNCNSLTEEADPKWKGSFRVADHLFAPPPFSSLAEGSNNSFDLRTINAKVRVDGDDGLLDLPSPSKALVSRENSPKSPMARTSPFQVTYTRDSSQKNITTAAASTVRDQQSPFGRSPPQDHRSTSSPISNFNLSAALSEASDQERARKIYEVVIERWKRLCEDFPNLGKEGALEIFYPEERILGIGGVNIVLYDLSHKLGRLLPCFVCPDLETFKAHLKKMANSSFTGKVAFIVRSLQFRAMDKRAPHVTPVLIERSEEGTKIMIMDSIGAEEGGGKIYPRGKSSEVRKEYRFFLDQATKRNDSTYQKSALMNVYMMIQGAQMDNIKVMFFAPKRQRDDTNCPIFSLHDVECFFKNPHFFQEVELFNSMKSDPEDDDLFSVSWLPPENMELTQSITQLKHYAQTTPLSRPGWSLGDLLSTCRSATPITPGDPKNTNAEDLKYKFLDQICMVAEADVNETARRASLFGDHAARQFFAGFSLNNPGRQETDF